MLLARSGRINQLNRTLITSCSSIRDTMLSSRNRDTTTMFISVQIFSISCTILQIYGSIFVVRIEDIIMRHHKRVGKSSLVSSPDIAMTGADTPVCCDKHFFSLSIVVDACILADDHFRRWIEIL
jgi:hypothetical protein